jgi:L-rhamnose mutarotase
MKPIKFGNGKALQITETQTIREIGALLKKYGVDIEYKKYHFLDKNRAQELKATKHSFVLNTFGTKYLLFLTKVNSKNYAIYINRKNESFYYVKTRFSEELYSDTVLEGETVKIGNDWSFLLSDIHLYRANNLQTQTFDERYRRMTKLLNEEYISDEYVEPFRLFKKEVFDYTDIKSVREKYVPTLPFQVNGYLFKSSQVSTYDILYIFPECRNKKDDEVGREPSESIVATDTSPKKMKEVPEMKDEMIFITRKTEYPDVYELYESPKAKMYDYAGIPTIGVSKLMREWFGEKTELVILFKKNKINERWGPVSVIN